MPSDRLLFNLVLAAVFMIAVGVNLWLAFGEYSRYRDARGLRGFVAAITMLAGVVALISGSSVFRETWPSLVPAMRLVSAAAVMAFLVGVAFSVASWRMGRGDRIRRRLTEIRDWPHAGDH